ncbi:MAG: biopolymer transporter ExbD [Bacteroidia bacterium]|nr:biopolymer transporter ExbD [Bacteroidia bacterium]
MAEIAQDVRPKKGSKTRRKSTKIDMTAMVDVAFLLLTFFVLTATMSAEGGKTLLMPPPEEELGQKKRLDELKIMTIVIGENDEIQYYVGITDIEVNTTNFSSNGIRQAMISHLKDGKGRPLCSEVENQGLREGKCWDPVFLVKPKKASTYKNLVDVLDELTVIGAPKYYIDAFTPDDSIRIALALAPEDGSTDVVAGL